MENNIGEHMTTTFQRASTLALMLAASSAAHAGLDCSGSHGGWQWQTSDSWTGTDKLGHFAVSAPFGALGGYLMRDTAHPIVYGTLIGTVPGLAKEVIDGTCRTDGFSYKDLAADALGALTGAALTHWAITYRRNAHGTTVGLAYTNRF
jgi:putative lipoprotein